METGARPRGTDGARVIQVIETKSLRGSGLNEKDKCRERKIGILLLSIFEKLC